MDPPTFEKLQEIAWQVIKRLQTIPGFSQVSVAIIGGVAVMKYLPRDIGRTTDVWIPLQAHYVVSKELIIREGRWFSGRHRHYASW